MGLPDDAFEMTDSALKARQIQTRVFDSADGKMILSASASVLQDLGFNLDETDRELGLLVASKHRDATEAGQVAFMLVVAVFTGIELPYDDTQKIQVSLVTYPAGERGDRTAVRAVFGRAIRNTCDVVRFEILEEPQIYQGFYGKLSQSVFLEAHQI
jgi:hypothetical protein